MDPMKMRPMTAKALGVAQDAMTPAGNPMKVAAAAMRQTGDMKDQRMQAREMRQQEHDQRRMERRTAPRGLLSAAVKGSGGYGG